MSAAYPHNAPIHYVRQGEATEQQRQACYNACNTLMLEALRNPGFPLGNAERTHRKLQHVALTTVMRSGFVFGQELETEGNTVEEIVERLVDGFLATDEAIEAIREARAIRAGPER